MQGGQRRDFVVLRMVLGIACVAAVGLIAAPVALANSPAGDQYGSALPGGGSTSGSSPSGGSGTTIPVAPDSSSSTHTATGGSSATNAKANHTGSGGGSSHNGHKADTKKASGTGSGNPDLNNASGHSVPQITADSAGDSWLPFFIGGMLALACAAAALVFFRNRRRTASG